MRHRICDYRNRPFRRIGIRARDTRFERRPAEAEGSYRSYRRPLRCRRGFLRRESKCRRSMRRIRSALPSRPSLQRRSRCWRRIASRLDNEGDRTPRWRPRIGREAENKPRSPGRRPRRRDRCTSTRATRRSPPLRSRSRGSTRSRRTRSRRSRRRAHDARERFGGSVLGSRGAHTSSRLSNCCVLRRVSDAGDTFSIRRCGHQKRSASQVRTTANS